MHLGKETAKMDMAMEKEMITQFIKAEGATRELLTEEFSNAKDQKGCHLIPAWIRNSSCQDVTRRSHTRGGFVL